MRKILIVAMLLAAWPARAEEDVSALLKRQTQAMYDALVPGDAKVWDGYLDAEALVTDENGAFADKTDTVAQVTPLPRGVSGNIVLTDWKVARHGDVAAVAYIVDEHEDFHGQHLHALYRATATWVRAAQGWKLLAQQTIALQQDPPEARLPAATLDEYVGRYSAAPDLTYEITRKGDDLLAGVAGGNPAPFKLELRDVGFVPGQPRVRKIFTRDAAGRVDGFVSRREGRDVVWRKIS